MEKTEFLDKVAQGLSSHGLGSNEVAKYTSRVSVLLDELPPDELSVMRYGYVTARDPASGKAFDKIVQL